MGGGYTITIPLDTPTASITQDGETLYFQGWMKNGVASTVYLPNDSVEVEENDVFTPYYAKDSDYSDFVFTVDSVTGEYILAGANKNMTTATIPVLSKGHVVNVIKNRAFYSYRSLQTVEMPQTITRIGDQAFQNCDSLTSIEIPDSVTSIGSEAFMYCNRLTTITIPKNVKTLGERIMVGCTALTEIIVDSENQNYCSVDGVLFDNEEATLLAYPCASTRTSYTISASVTYVKASAFSFSKNLQNIWVETGNNDFTSIDGVLFSKDKTVIHQYPIGRTATSYTIPEGTITNKMYVFNGNQYLTTVVFPSTYKTIVDVMCDGMDALTSVIIPENITKIGKSAFQGCPQLKSVTFENTNGWYATSSSSYTGGSSIDVTVPSDNAINFISSTAWINYYLYRK